MAQRKSIALAELRVGILVIASFLMLALAIFFIGGESSGLLTPKYRVIAYFPSADGLRTGAEVWLEGVQIGNVRRVRISRQPDPNRSVEAEMSLDETYQNIVRTDSIVTIGTIGLLGDKVVEISRGTEAGQVVQDGGSLQGQELGDIKQIITGTNDFVANLEVLSDQITRMAGRVDRGEGTLGKLLSDASIYDNANLAVREANLLVRDARTGNGTVGRLLSDDELYAKVSQMIDRSQSLIAKIESGQGTAGKLVNDPALYNRAEALISRIDNIADRIERGEGTLGKLAKDEAIYTETRQAIGKVSTLLDSIENGKGTAGRLVQDPTLYNSFNQASSEVLKLLYDFRQDPKKFLTINFKLF